MEYVHIFLLSLITVCGSQKSNTTENSKTQLRSENATVQRIFDLESFLLPLPADEISHVINETVKRYIPVNSESQLCREHSLLVVQSFHQRHLWALKNFKNPPSKADGPPSPLSKLTTALHTALDRNIKGVWLQMNENYPTDLTFSICVPSSCSVEDVATHVDSVLAQVNASTMYSFMKNTGVEESSLDKFLTCSEKTKPSFRLEDYIALSTFITAGCILIAFTFFTTQFGAKSVFSGISLSSSFKGLMDTRVPTNEISCLNGLRVIFMLLVLAYHRLYAMMYFIPSNRRKTIVETLSSVTLRLMEASTMSVDVFLLMGGIVASYTFFLRKEKQQPMNLWRTYLMRYFRLTPVLAVLMLFYSTLSIHTSKGPIWPRSVERIEHPCRNYWWTGLLQISNYYNPGEVCVSQSWYVACDFQLYVLSPLILLPIYQKPKLGPFIIIVNVLVPVAVMTAKSFMNDLYPGSMFNVIELQRDTNDSSVVDYQGFHFRICYYVMGIGLGYLLFLIKHNKKEISFSKPIFTAGWFTAGLVLTTYIVLSLIVFHPDHVFKPWFDPLFNGFAKPLACLAVAWIIFACSLGRGGVVDRFLSWSAFRPLARLVYSVYLVHVLVLLTQSYSVKVPQAFSFRDFIFLVCGDATISFFLATVLYVTVEVPCSKLANNLLAGKKTREDGHIPTQQLPPTIPPLKEMEFTKM